MAFTADRSFASLYDESFAHDVATEIADAVGDAMFDGARDKTPQANLPLAYKGDLASWIEDRGGRKPGTLRQRWRRTGVQGTPGSGLKVTVWNPDPVARLVEWNTRPHAIRAKQRVRADGGTYQGLLRYPQGPVFRYNVEVWHPGTQGQHMMRNTLAEIEVKWVSIAERVLDLYATFYSERY